jgi:hypothetical protein
MGRYPKRRPMITYVVHIDERPIVAFRAVSQTEARELIKELWFQTELQARTSHGIPLWRSRAKLSIRAATASEAEAATPLLIAVNPSEGLALAYLVALDRAANGKLVPRR